MFFYTLLCIIRRLKLPRPSCHNCSIDEDVEDEADTWRGRELREYSPYIMTTDYWFSWRFVQLCDVRQHFFFIQTGSLFCLLQLKVPKPMYPHIHTFCTFMFQQSMSFHLTANNRKLKVNSLMIIKKSDHIHGS